MVSAVRLGHGRDGHQRTGIPSQRLAENLLPEVNLFGVDTFFQDIKVSLEETRQKYRLLIFLVITILENNNKAYIHVTPYS